MLALTPAAPWTPPIVQTVATTGEGVDRLWDAIEAHRRYLVDTGELERRRRERARDEIRELVKAQLARLAEECCRGPRFEAIVHEQTQSAFDPQRVAEQVVAEAFGTPSR
jgi:LAO/AO transport system kinase